MRHMRMLVGLVVAGSVCAGCASMCAPKKTAMTGPDPVQQLRTETNAKVQAIETRLGAIESSQNELREEVRTMTGLQQGLRQQLDALAQEHRNAPETPDEK